MAQLSAWIRAKLAPSTLFGRLALLLFAAMLTGHLLALALMFQLWPDMFGNGSESGLMWEAEPGEMIHAPRPPPAESWGTGISFFHPGFWLDLGIRLPVLVLMAWICARWLLPLMQRVISATHEFEHDIQCLHQRGTSTEKCREMSQISKPAPVENWRLPSANDFFVAAVSHDLRAPLTRLALRVEGLSDEEQQRGFWRDIGEMNTMITSTLNHLRGAVDPEPFVSLDLVSLLTSVADDQLACGHTVRIINASPSPFCAPLRTQASSLRRCISNLVDNAVRHGGSADIRYADAVDHVSIEISDCGPGIAEAELDKVLIPFYRAESSRNSNSSGMGLGLSIASSIVQRLQGQIHLKNGVSGGLIITVMLPR